MITQTRSCRHFEIVTGDGDQKYCGMKLTKNVGMVLLAVYLIIDGLLGFGLNLGPFVFLLYLVALAAGVLILIGK
jgi:hypothetical protein